MGPVVQFLEDFLDDLDKVSAEKDAAVTELTARIVALEARVAAAGEQLAQARAAEQEAVREASVAAARLAAAEARAKTLQEAHDALLDRVAPAALGTDPGARPAPGGKD